MIKIILMKAKVARRASMVVKIRTVKSDTDVALRAAESTAKAVTTKTIWVKN